jgi:hypothetical protein
MVLGAAPEVIVDDQTGFLGQTLEDCVAAIAKVHDLDRHTCRTHVETHFGVQRMVDGYEVVYQQLLRERTARNGHIRASNLVS